LPLSTLLLSSIDSRCAGHPTRSILNSFILADAAAGHEVKVFCRLIGPSRDEYIACGVADNKVDRNKGRETDDVRYFIIA